MDFRNLPKEKLMPVFIAIILIQILFGINFVTSKYVLSVMDPFTFTFFRFLLGGSILFGISSLLQTRKSFSLKDLFKNKYLLMGIFSLFAGQLLFMLGLRYSSAFNASIISISIPIFTMIIAFFRNQISISSYKIAGLVLALCGAFILKASDFQEGSISLGGDFFILFACLFFALHISISKDLFEKTPVLLGTSILFLISSIFVFPFIFIFGDITSILNISVTPYWEAGLFCLFGGTVSTYCLNNWAIKRVNPFKLSIFIYLQSVVAGLLGYHYLAEEITAPKVLASLLIFVAVFLIYIEKANQEANQEADK